MQPWFEEQGYEIAVIRPDRYVAALMADPQFTEFRKGVRALLVRQENCILRTVVFPAAKQ